MSDSSLIRGFVEAIDEGDEAAIRDVLADEIDAIDVDRSITQDRVVEDFMSIDAALSDIEYSIARSWDESDGVHAIDIRVSGVFDDEYRLPNPTGDGELSVEPTGESVSGLAVYLLSVEDDEIVAMRNHGFEEMLLSMGVYEFGGEPVEEDQADSDSAEGESASAEAEE